VSFAYNIIDSMETGRSRSNVTELPMVYMTGCHPGSLALNFAVMKRLALLLSLGLAACADNPGEDGWSYCYVGSDASAKCFAQKHEQPDDVLYALETCRTGGGTLRSACPNENRLGYCESVGNTPTSAGFKPRTMRTHEYRHPDILSDEVVASIAKRCSGTWVPAKTESDK
jgi:hypothetical protein